ncbi:MAG: NAD(P) transhydrogenase subunit beta [Planctomycetota bacterium]
MLDLLLAETTSAPASAPVAGVSGDLRLFIINLAYLAASACFIFGLRLLKAPRSARRGNMIAATGMAIAILATLVHPNITHGGSGSLLIILVGLGLGAAIGATLALKIHMRGMPQMVALLNGFGGLAASLVGLGEYIKEDAPAGNVRFAVAMSIVIGMITFTGSLIAFGKLEELKYKILGQPLSGPVMLPQQKLINLGGGLVLLALILTLAGLSKYTPIAVILYVLAALYGFAFVLPIGGADMPVVIALLNSFSGLGAASTGFVLNNNALIIGGSLVGAAGLILTLDMSRAMNRSIFNILKGGFGAAPAEPGQAAKASQTIRKMDADEAAILLDAAQHVVIVPGYGMAVAQAQHAVAELAAQLAKKGVSVKYAVHPVAGRMPGHMNVLLAEANVPYEQLADLEINPEFAQCDVALVIGANDVVNPAARHDKASPIYGMPIFDCDKARTVMVCKRSMNPGYAGIENELFGLPNTVMLFGDAKATVSEINKALKDM